VVVVPFPYADRLAEKRRPALVVSNQSLAQAGLVWVVMITTAKRGATEQDIAIEDRAAAGLPVPCVVRPAKIACIEPERILRRAGHLAAPVADACSRPFEPSWDHPAMSVPPLSLKPEKESPARWRRTRSTWPF